MIKKLSVKEVLCKKAVQCSSLQGWKQESKSIDSPQATSSSVINLVIVLL